MNNYALIFDFYDHSVVCRVYPVVGYEKGDDENGFPVLDPQAYETPSCATLDSAAETARRWIDEQEGGGA